MRVLVFRLLVRTLFRYFVTGQAVSGRATDNATFFYAASQDLRGKPYEKLSGPIWQRLTRRWAALGVPLCLMGMSVVARVWQYVSTVDPAWTRVQWLHMAYRWWIVLGLAGLVYGAWQGIQLLRHRRTTNEFVYPTWEAACKVLGAVYHKRDARRMVALPDGFEPSDVDIDGPTRHHWALRWTRIARVLDWWADRKLAQEQAQMAQEQADREAEAADNTAAEPDTVPSTDLVVRDRPGWLVYADRFRPTARRTGSSVVTEEAPEPPVVISLPPGRVGSDAQKKAFTNAVGPVLGMPEPQAEWYLTGQHPYVKLRPTRLPPPKVTFEDVKKYFESSTLSRPFVGIAAGGRPVYLDLDNESPHNLVSGPTGTGKSTLLKTPIPIRMHLGSGLIIGDFKRVSHLWAHNLPGCVYAWKIEQIHNVFVAAGQELMRRISGVLPDDYDHTIELTKFQVWDIVVEEINSLTPMLQRYWQGIRSSQDPVPSPALTAIQQIIFMGREMGMHVWVGSQRAAANVFGGDGGSTRENFAARFMAKWTKQTWAMLAGGIPYLKCPRGGRGIWTLIQGDEADIIRVPHLTNAEARNWAMSGVPSPPTPLDADLSVEPAGPIVPAGVTAPELVTLSKALEWLPGPPMTLAALRQAASPERAKVNGFPTPAGEAGAAKTYSLEALTRWKSDLDGRKGIEESWELPEPRRLGRVYRFNVLDPVTGASVCGYVGQTRRPLTKREDEHRWDKPWADLIIGEPLEIWYSDSCTQQELDGAELHLIHTLKPLYNYEGQEGADHAIPKWTQLEERHARDAAAGLPPWRPVDIYNERRTAVI